MRRSKLPHLGFSEPGFVNPDGSPLRKQGEPHRAEDVSAV